MDDSKLTVLLKEMLVVFNRESRLVPPRLEREMCLALDKVGGSWLLAGLQARGISGAEEVEQTSDNWWQVLRTEEGRRQLKSAVAANKAAIKDMRRRVVGLIHAFGPANPGMALKVDPVEGNGGIYRMLIGGQPGKGGSNEDSLHHNQG